MKPITKEHDGITVVRDDLFKGGTKARYLRALVEAHGEIVYASPAEGGAQTAMATFASADHKVTIFTASRAEPHPRTLMAKALGAKVVLISPGYLNVVQARAAEYAAKVGAYLVPFGADLPEAHEAIASAARSLRLKPDEVWSAGGSGVLARGLAAAWPDARRHVVQVGRELSEEEVAGAEIHVAPLAFGKPSKEAAPFPSDPHYDAKAWAICKARRGAGLVLFWNVTGPATL